LGARITGKNPPQKSANEAGMLLKTHGEKISVYRLLAILMKANELKSLSRDVDENEGERC